MTDYFHLNIEHDKLLSLSSLGLAHLGDSVYEVMVRSWLCLQGAARVKDLHRATVRYVAAPAQAVRAQRILPILTQEEQDVFRLGQVPPRYYSEETLQQLISFAAYFTDPSDLRLSTAALLFLREAEVFTELLKHLNEGKLARTFDGTDEDMALIATSDLLTLKKTIYVANLAENEINEPENNRHYMAVKTLADEEGSQCLPICAKLEADIAELDDPEEKAMFMEELGVAESGLDRLIRSSYALLGLISFLTAGSDECRAWTIRKGTKAPQAAGKIHTDFERGFIRAEVIAFEDMKACGTMAAAKAKGLVRSEGKEYVMKDGDIVNFLFNV